MSTRTRTVDFDDPSLTAAAAAGRTGLELLRDLIARKVPAAPIQATLGFELFEATDGFAKLQLVSGEHLFGAHGSVQSGVAAMLLEVAMGSAVMTTLDAAASCSTVTLTTHLTRAITARTATVIGEGWVVHRGSRLVTAEGRLTDEQGRLLAHGSATCAIAPRPG